MVNIIFRIKDSKTGEIVEFGQEKASLNSVLIVFTDQHFLKEKVPISSVTDDIVITFSGEIEFIKKRDDK